MLIDLIKIRPFVFLLFIQIILIVIFFSFTQKNEFVESEILACGDVIEEPSFSNGKTIFLMQLKYKEVYGKRYLAKEKVKVVINGRLNASYKDKILARGDFILPKKATNLGQFDAESYYSLKNIAGILYVNKSSDIKILSKDRGIIKTAIDVKNHILDLFRLTLPNDQANLLGSILFGSKASPVSQETVENYRKSGVVHLLVASGNRISILLGICFFLQKFFNLSGFSTSVFATALIWLFTFMAGWGPSILRATVMGQISILGGIFDKDKDFYNTLCASAFIILTFVPKLLFDVGFQLSFAATWSFVYIAPVISKLLEDKIPKFWADSFSIAFSPYLATLPLNLFYFSTLSFVGIFANMVIVPLAEIITTMGFIFSVMLLFLKPIAQVFSYMLSAMLLIMDFLVGIFANLPFSFGSFGSFNIFFVLGYYAILVYNVEKIKMDKFCFRKKNFLRFSFVFFLVFLFFGLASSFAQKNLEMTVLDVGQGDSIFLSLPDGQNILIDAGPPKVGKNVVIPFLRKNGINKLDLAILTHAHDDHVGGYPFVLKNIKVEKVFDPGVPHTSSWYINFLKLVKDKNIKYYNPRGGEFVDFGKTKMYILAPYDPIDTSDLNNSSIVTRFVYGNTSFLLMGDAPTMVENQIILHNYPLKSDVLKVGHHGSRYSTGVDFLDKVAPKIAIISVGAHNRYGHPSKRVIDLLESKNIKIYRTDLNGSVKVISDGENIKVHAQKNN